MTKKLVLLAVLCIGFVLSYFALTFTFAPPKPYTRKDYEDLLTKLWSANRTISIVHDCDFQVEGIKNLLEVERNKTISAIYFLRPNADYFTQNIPYFQRLESEGVKFGFHYDCLSRLNGSIEAATKLFTAQLTYMRAFLNISYTRSHGDNYNLKINNHDLYNATKWVELGLTDYSNECGLFTGYISDTNHEWHYSDPLGSHVLVNLHSDYW